jgi:hypothetical protein
MLCPQKESITLNTKRAAPNSVLYKPPQFPNILIKPSADGIMLVAGISALSKHHHAPRLSVLVNSFDLMPLLVRDSTKRAHPSKTSRKLIGRWKLPLCNTAWKIIKAFRNIGLISQGSGRAGLITRNPVIIASWRKDLPTSPFFGKEKTRLHSG